MGPRLIRWLQELSSFQRRRGAGQVPTPWREWEVLKTGVDSLAIEGLDFRAAAKSLIELERAGLLYEERRFDEALQVAAACEIPQPVHGVLRELFTANRELTIGNIYLARDADAAAALSHFERAIAASGPDTLTVRGNAAVNLGICQGLMGRPEESIKSYELAAEAYDDGGRPDKLAVAVHSLGNAYRQLDRVDEGVRFLGKAVELFSKHNDFSGLWQVGDDLSRAYLTIAAERPNERDKWLDLAADISDGAFAAGTKVWDTLAGEERRLADLSDQMVNHTVTRCEIAVLREEPEAFLGALALMKGRIRFSAAPLPEEFLNDLEPEIREAASSGIPTAYFLLVEQALQRLAGARTIALLDQISLRGGQLMMSYLIHSPEEKRLGGFHTCLPDVQEYDASGDLRARRRGSQIEKECQQLLEVIVRHGARCSMVLPANPAWPSESDRAQLEEWASELRPALRRLGELFFPAEILDEFRLRGVEHVVLCIDPLFARVPYSAIVGSHGPIVDEPWSLSLITSSTELIRLLDRQSQPATSPAPIVWFGPDRDVNEGRGGNDEVERLSQLAAVLELREQEATLPRMCRSLSEGQWCHFRGHGRWTGSVETSGPVLASGSVLTSKEYPNRRSSATPSVLYTAACFTGFGEAVGIEVIGSLVDYDRADLLAAVLTSWPIHGDAATVFTSLFYQELSTCRDAAVALRRAAQRVRALLPHPYLWAPFMLVGGWNIGDLILWTTDSNGNRHGG